MVTIIDKNPRKPRKEGPKAQKKYLDELQEEWFDGHAVHEVVDEPEPPAHIQEQYEARQERAIAAIRSRQQREAKRAHALGRRDVVAKKAAWEMQTFGYLRDATAQEVIELGLDV